MQVKGDPWAKLVCDHWGIEARNHGRRDACLFEDKTRGKNANIVANFCIARAALLYFNAQTATGNVNAFSEECRDSKGKTLGLIMRRRNLIKTPWTNARKCEIVPYLNGFAPLTRGSPP